MSSPGNPPACDGMYAKLIDEEAANDGFSIRPEVSVQPVFPVRLTPRPGGAGPYRLATFCLAALSGVLLISVIAVVAHYKKVPQGGAEELSTLQTQRQDKNVSALVVSISKLQQEKQQLQKEKDELLARLSATNAPGVIRRTTVTTTATAPIVCPDDWHLFNNSCYFISRTTRDWPESQSYCQSKGGHLAIILTAEEQTFLWNLLPRGHWNTFWFGITDEHTEDQWKWVDGTPLVGGFWEVGEPNNHIDEDCGYIVKTRVESRVAIRSWYDAPCSMYCRFICEKEMGAGASNSTALPH